jgi:hypothetical protein
MSLKGNEIKAASSKRKREKRSEFGNARSAKEKRDLDSAYLKIQESLESIPIKVNENENIFSNFSVNEGIYFFIEIYDYFFTSVCECTYLEIDKKKKFETVISLLLNRSDWFKNFLICLPDIIVEYSYSYEQIKKFSSTVEAILKESAFTEFSSSIDDLIGIINKVLKSFDQNLSIRIEKN